MSQKTSVQAKIVSRNSTPLSNNQIHVINTYRRLADEIADKSVLGALANGSLAGIVVAHLAKFVARMNTEFSCTWIRFLRSPSCPSPTGADWHSKILGKFGMTDKNSTGVPSLP